MRSLRLAAMILTLALVAAACGDDGETPDEATEEGETTTTTRSVSTTTTQPTLTTPTTSEAPTTTVVEVAETPTTSTTEAPASTESLAPPPAPSNLRCVGGTAENELVLEFDALPTPSDIAKVRAYMQLEGQPVIANGEFTVGQIDTSRSGGARWAVPVRDVPVNTAVTLYATSFNQLGQESGWYSVAALYTGAGAPCVVPTEPELPPTTCTAGCDEEEGEPGA